jgi:hypothetical protein
MMARKSGALALGLAMALLGLVAPPAGGHGGDLLARPIIERVRPQVDGVVAEVAFSVNFEIILENKTSTDVSVVAPTGEAFLRIGPQGVFANWTSPFWFDSNSPAGSGQAPDWVKPGPEHAPDWRRVSADPSWGWYDHRLHPVERYIDPEIKKKREPSRLGDWSVPIRYGDQDGGIEGYFEYKPPVGSWKTVLKSSDSPAEGVKVGIVSSEIIPALYVENNSPKTVMVLGREGEPFVRLGPKAEVNITSPLYVEITQARGQTPRLPADAQAAPSWEEVGSRPRWGWLELRARPPTEPPKKAVESKRSTDVVSWSVPLVIGDERIKLDGVTQFIPIAGLQRKDGGSDLPLYVAVLLGSAGVAFLVLRPRRKKAAKGQAPRPGSRPKREARHRSRSAPKVRH